MEAGGRLGYAVWHRRAGKDDVALHWTCVAAHKRAGNYWHMLPQAEQARKAIWTAINPHTGKFRIDEAFPKELRARTREDTMMIQLKCGSTWQVVGSDNYDSAVGSPPVGIVFSEWALAKPQAWAYFRPIWRENKGWAMFITTPRGPNHAQKMYQSMSDDPHAFAQTLPATETSVFSAEDLAQEKQSYIGEYGPTMGLSMFEQEYMCSFTAAILGSYYGKDIQIARDAGRITEVPHQPHKLVNCAFDLGKADSTAIWFWQTSGGQHRVIDYLEDRGEDITYYLEKLRAKGYRYDTLYLPHDADENRIGMDKTIIQQVRSNGFKAVIVPRHSLREGINISRQLLAKAVIDSTRCAEGLDALQNYRADYNQKLQELKEMPVHDWASHGADAWRYMAISEREEPRPEFEARQVIETRGIV